MSDPTSYDDVPYPSLPTWYTHPAVMAQRALLLGLEPPRLSTCRVLELGAGPGGNIIPMAEQLPGARFLGVDLSAGHVAAGQALAVELGLSNVELRHASILDVDQSDGPFDYIICHGVYSWVPPAVQEHILWACQALLSENGLACVSYNCLPGWFLHGMLRTLMLRESRAESDPERRLDSALDAMRSLATDLAATDNVRAKHLHQEIELFDRHDRGYLFHEYLEEVNEPVYFYQLLERLERHGLAHLADLTPLGPRELPAGGGSQPGEPEAALFARLQRQDILSDRRFRCSLLARATGQTTRSVAPGAVLRLHARCPMHSLTIDMRPDEPVRISRGDGPEHVPSRPVEKAFLALTERWPGPLAVADLWELGRAAAEPAGDGPDAFAAELLQLYRAGIIDLYAACPHVAGRSTSHPRLRPLNLAEARQGHALTNPWHHRINIAEYERTLVPWLAGQPRAELEPRIAQALRTGELPQGEQDPDEVAPRIAEFVLAGMADCGLLLEPGPEGLTLEEWR